MTTTQQLMDNIRQRNRAMGLGVRCPTCGHGVGKPCTREGVALVRTAADVVTHPERVALARERGLI